MGIPPMTSDANMMLAALMRRLFAVGALQLASSARICLIDAPIRPG